MKTFASTLLILLVSSFVQAQEPNELHYLNSNQIRGVYQLGTEAAVLSFIENRSIDKKDVFTLSYLNEQYKPLEIAIPENSQLHTVESSPETAILIFESRDRQEVYNVYVTANSRVEYHSYAGEADYRSGGIRETALNQSGNLIMVRNYSEMGLDDKGKEVVLEHGTEILNFDKSGNLAGRRLEKAEGTVWSTVVGITPIPEGAVLMYELSDYKNREYNLEIRICDNIGNVTGTYNLTQDGGYFPTDIVSDNGNIVLSGYYVKGSVFSAQKTEGLFLTILDKQGGLQNRSTFDWDNLKSNLKETKRSDFIFTGKMKVMVEKIEPINSGYQIICETYSSGGGTTTAEFLLGGNSTANQHVITVYDFVVFQTDKSGELTSVNIIPKQECNIDMGGLSKRTGSMAMANLIKKYRVFPFQSYNNGKISFVNYKNHEPYYAELNVSSKEITEGKKITFEPVIEEKVDKDWEAAKSNSGALSKLDRFAQKTDNFSNKLDEAGKKLEYAVEKIDYVFRPYGKSNDGYYMLSNKVVSYLIHPDTYKVFYLYVN